jgi:hypothetical protein
VFDGNEKCIPAVTLPFRLWVYKEIPKQVAKQARGCVLYLIQRLPIFRETQLLQLQVNKSNRIIVATEATALISKYKQLQKTSITQLLMFILKKSSAFKKKQLLFECFR